MACLSDEDLLGLVEARVPAAEAARIEAHLDACDDCRALVADTARVFAPAEPASGARIGRYVISRFVGEGAMGAVYAAYDPELDRRVALKLLRPDATTADRADLQARLRREAQAMARLSHPHVITVHDVGEADGRVFIAMELCEGTTLGRWAREMPRSWREILAAYREAGAGLAAAHAAGLVHCDFKPDNVLIAADGRTRVTDFGLAAPATSAAAADGGEGPAAVTRAALLGTPAYMAPEQLVGQPADAASDVFSFCAALYEALHGQRPFAGTTVNELRAAMAAGRVSDPPARPRVPLWLRRILVRALTSQPGQRGSMKTLLAALGRDPARLRWGLADALTLLVLATLAVLLVRRPVHAALDPCPSALPELAGIWDAPRRLAVRQALTASQLPFAEHVAGSTERALDLYTGRWLEAHANACQATRVRGAQSEELMDRRMQCLAGRLRDVRALTRLLVSATPELVARAPEAVSRLPGLERCANVELLSRELPAPDPAQAAAVADVESRVADLRAALEVGRYDEAAGELASVRKAAHATHHAPVMAEVELLRGQTLVYQGKWDDAELALHQAAATGEVAHDDDLMAQSWLLLVEVVGIQGGDYAHGLLWSAYTRAALQREGGDPAIEASLDTQTALLLARRGQYADAAGMSQRAIALGFQQHERTAFAMAEDSGNLAIVLAESGRPDLAEPIDRAVYDTLLDVAGPDHPSTAVSEANLAQDLVLLGRPAEGAPLLQRALAVQQQLFGADHPTTRTTALGLAEARLALGQPDAAHTLLEQALPSAQRAGASANPLDVEMLTTIGIDELALGDAHAAATLERALTLGREAKLRLDQLAVTQFALARALVASPASKQRALTLARQARAAYQGPDHDGPMYQRLGRELDAWLAPFSSPALPAGSPPAG